MLSDNDGTDVGRSVSALHYVADSTSLASFLRRRVVVVILVLGGIVNKVVHIRYRQMCCKCSLTRLLV